MCPFIRRAISSKIRKATLKWSKKPFASTLCAHFFKFCCGTMRKTWKMGGHSGHKTWSNQKEREIASTLPLSSSKITLSTKKIKNSGKGPVGKRRKHWLNIFPGYFQIIFVRFPKLYTILTNKKASTNCVLTFPIVAGGLNMTVFFKNSDNFTVIL